MFQHVLEKLLLIRHLGSRLNVHLLSGYSEVLIWDHAWYTGDSGIRSPVQKGSTVV